MTTQNPEVNSRPFFLSIPETVARNPNLSAAAKCVAGSIYTRTHQRNVRPGVFVLIRADWIAAEWSMSADAVTAGIKQLEEAGIVERNRTRAGNALRWSSYEDPENQESGKSGIRKKRNDIPEKAESRFRKKRNALLYRFLDRRLDRKQKARAPRRLRPFPSRSRRPNWNPTNPYWRPGFLNRTGTRSCRRRSGI